MSTAQRIDPIRYTVHTLRPKRYTIADAAELVQRSRETLARWRKSGLVVPSDSMNFGTTTVYLYTDSDVRKLRRVAATQRPGRKTHATTQRKSRRATMN